MLLNPDTLPADFPRQISGLVNRISLLYFFTYELVVKEL